MVGRRERERRKDRRQRQRRMIGGKRKIGVIDVKRRERSFHDA